MTGVAEEAQSIDKQYVPQHYQKWLIFMAQVKWHPMSAVL